MNQSAAPAHLQAWLVLSFGDDRQHGGNTGYRDDPERVYRYDSFVPNHKRMSPRDLLVIVGRDSLIGFARIAAIEKHRGLKKFLRCPACRTSGIKKRKLAKILFRCNHGHEFNVPLEEEAECTEYEAHYGNSFIRATTNIPTSALRRACPKYTDQLAIQVLDFNEIRGTAYSSAPGLEDLLDSPFKLSASTAEFRATRQVSAEDVLAVLGSLDRDGVPARHQAKLFEVVHDGGRYPAKYVVFLASRNASKNVSSAGALAVSESVAAKILRRLGFGLERIGGAIEVTKDLIEIEVAAAEDWEFNPTGIEDARERVAGEILKRRGQPDFRKRLLRMYGNRCAITGCDAIEVLEACHIVPYLGPNTNHLSNGLILRSDIHTLFDLGLIAIEPDTMRIVVAPSLHRTEYGRLEGQHLRKPLLPACTPSAQTFEERRRRLLLD